MKVWALFLLAMPLAAQPANPLLVFVSASPSGACSSASPWQYNLSNGTGWYCGTVTAGAGTWAQITSVASVNALLPQRTSCGTGTTCTVTTLTSPLKDAYGTVQLSGGTATVTGVPAFTSTTTAQCSCEDTSSPLQACSAVLASTTSVTANGNTNDIVKWHCFGN